MSHSNQCEDSKCQTKLDTERDEAHAVVLCFWCEQLPLVTIEGVSLCADHALGSALMCRCDRYGAYGHEELVYCSQDCLDVAHVQAEMTQDDVEEGQR